MWCPACKANVETFPKVRVIHLIVFVLIGFALMAEVAVPFVYYVGMLFVGYMLYVWFFQKRECPVCHCKNLEKI